MTKQKLLVEIEKRRKAIGLERDRLNNLISDATDLLETCQEAEEALESAGEALSRCA